MLVFSVCLVLVITSAGNFKVSGTEAVEYEVTTLEGGCPNINELEEVKRQILRNIEPQIVQLSETIEQSPTTNEDTQNTAIPTEQTTEQSMSTTEQSMSTTEQSMSTTEQSMSTTEQNMSTTDQTTSEETTVPTTEQTTEQSTSITTDPLYYTCNGTPGWRQVVFIDMTNISYNCPPGLNLTLYDKRTCGQTQLYFRGGCSSTTFSVGFEYSRVCGRIKGYQAGTTLSFRGYFQDSQQLDGLYVDGVSLTHGTDGGREHIWTFAAGLNEEYNGYGVCPCVTITQASPPFVGADYFCESGTDRDWRGRGFNGEFFPDDPLWDGQGCSSNSTCCDYNNPPWFTKNLTSPTTNDIELRLCSYNPVSVSAVPLELIELYVL